MLEGFSIEDNEESYSLSREGVKALPNANGPRLIINADDLGLSRGVNAGIEQAHQAGVVTSASLMVNLPAFNDAIEVVRRNPKLSVGLHLNLSVGPPVDNQTGSSLVNVQGVFDRPFKRFSELPMDQVEREWRGQILRFMNLGHKPTHIDSHHHIHLHPRLFPLSLRLASEFQILAVRVANPQCIPWDDLDEALNPGGLINPSGIKDTWRLADCWQASHDIKFCQGLFGFPQKEDSLLQRLNQVLPQLHDGSYEFFCHPALPDQELSLLSRFIDGRKAELDVLTDPGLVLKLQEHGVELVNYQDLTNS